MGTDDGDIEDDGLSAFRSAWRTMPDEEPPQRGLAELMAAARVKADEMAAAQQPSLWQRFVDMMRRPQVLALATIMILIGGAVFISQRRDKLEAPSPEATSAPVATSNMGSGSAAGEAKPMDEFAAEQDKAQDLKREVSKESAAAPAQEAAKADRGRDDQTIAAPEAKAEAVPRGAVTQGASKKASPKKPSKGKASLDDMDSPFFEGGVTGGDSTGAMNKVGGGGGGGTGTSTGAATTKPGGTTTTPPPDSKPKADPKTEEETPSVKQLWDQARAAAAKGDCALVRSLAKKIAAQDAPYYRANIAPDKSLAACLN